MLFRFKTPTDIYASSEQSDAYYPKHREAKLEYHAPSVYLVYKNHRQPDARPRSPVVPPEN